MKWSCVEVYPDVWYEFSAKLPQSAVSVSLEVRVSSFPHHWRTDAFRAAPRRNVGSLERRAGPGRDLDSPRTWIVRGPG